MGMGLPADIGELEVRQVVDKLMGMELGQLMGTSLVAGSLVVLAVTDIQQVVTVALAAKQGHNIHTAEVVVALEAVAGEALELDPNRLE